MINTQMYVSSNSFTQQCAIDSLEPHKKHFTWTERERILDIGSGPGDITATILLPFLPKDATLVGGDVSDDMIKYASSVNKRDRLTYKKVNIEDNNIAKFELGFFNKIFGFQLMHWVIDHRKALENMYSLLKPSGDIFLIFFTPDLCTYVSIETVILSEKWQKYKKEERMWFYETNDPVSYFKTMLQEVGFKDIICYKKSCCYNYPTWDVFMDLIQAVNPYMSFIPPEKRPEFQQDLGEYMKKEKYLIPDEVNGGVNMPYYQMIILAKKIE